MAKKLAPPGVGSAGWLLHEQHEKAREAEIASDCSKHCPHEQEKEQNEEQDEEEEQKSEYLHFSLLFANG